MQHNLTSTAVALICFRWLLNKKSSYICNRDPLFSPRVARCHSLTPTWWFPRRWKMTFIKTPSSDPKQLQGIAWTRVIKRDSKYLRRSPPQKIKQSLMDAARFRIRARNRHLQKKKDFLKKIVFPHQLAMKRRASLRNKILLASSRRLLKSPRFALRRQHSVSVYSPISCCYSRATPDWAQRRRGALSCVHLQGREKKKTPGWWYPAYIFVVICVFQVKLQIRGHFHHQRTTAGGIGGEQGHSYGQFYITSV